MRLKHSEEEDRGTVREVREEGRRGWPGSGGKALGGFRNRRDMEWLTFFCLLICLSVFKE